MYITIYNPYNLMYMYNWFNNQRVCLIQHVGLAKSSDLHNLPLRPPLPHRLQPPEAWIQRIITAGMWRSLLKYWFWLKNELNNLTANLCIQISNYMSICRTLALESLCTIECGLDTVTLQAITSKSSKDPTFAAVWFLKTHICGLY